MKKLLFFIILFAQGYILNSKTLTVKPAAGAIILDGSGNEDTWKQVPFIEMDQNKGDAEYKNNTARFKMTYDKSYVYVYVEILDSKIDTSQSKSIWINDCVELYISLDTANQKTVINGQNGFWQYRKKFSRPMTDFIGKDFKVEEKDISGGKSQEWQLAWDSLASTIKDATKWNKCNFRFDLQNVDNDEFGVLSQLFWNSNADDQWNSTYNLGYVVMQYYLNNRQIEPAKDAIIIYSDHIEFEKRSNYCIYNSAGKLIREGHESVNVNIADLKKGVYLIKTNDSCSKFMK